MTTSANIPTALLIFRPLCCWCVPALLRFFTTLGTLGSTVLRAQWLIIHLGISLAQANTAGHTKKNVQYSILYIGYALGMSIWPQETCAMSGLNPTLIRWQTGNLIGPQTFRESQAPEYTGGFTVMF